MLSSLVSPSSFLNKKAFNLHSRTKSQPLSTLQRKKTRGYSIEGVPLYTSTEESILPRRRPLRRSFSTNINASDGFEIGSDGELGSNGFKQDRPQKELVEWQVNPPAGFKHKVIDNLQRWVIEVNGAPGTLYANETYQLQVDFFEHYPMEAPLHPHI